MLTRKRIDAIQGPILSQMLVYSFPLLLSTIVQQLFNALDIAVVGNFADTTSVAAVGATSSMKNLLMAFFYGISAGMCVILARALGANDRAKAKHTVDTGILFYGFYSIITILIQTLQSFGYSSLSSLSSVICVFGVRVLWMTFVYPRYQTYPMLASCFLFSWVCLFALSLPMAVVVLLRYRKGKYKKL